MDSPLSVEIIAYAPTAYYHCTHCEVVWHEANITGPIHQEQLDSSLPGDLASEYREISLWVEDLFHRYLNQITLKVIDVASLEGVFKSLQYGVHRYPAVIVDHRAKFTSLALKNAGEEIDRILGQA